MPTNLIDDLVASCFECFLRASEVLFLDSVIVDLEIGVVSLI